MLIREEMNRGDKKHLELLTNRRHGDVAARSLQALNTAAATSNRDRNATQWIAIGQQLLEQFLDAKSVDRLLIDFDRVIKDSFSVRGDVVSRDVDMLGVPK